MHHHIISFHAYLMIIAPITDGKDELVEEKVEVKADETKQEKEDRERRQRFLADRRRRAETKAKEAAERRERRKDKRNWPWHPDLVLESFGRLNRCHLIAACVCDSACSCSKK
jgi:hypothetical protein